eukprot:tig00001284_g8008.t1
MPGPGGPGLHQFALLVNDTHTEVVISDFADRVFVGISQIGKWATWAQAHKDTTIEGAETFSVRTLLGAPDDPVPAIYARAIIPLVSKKTDRPLLLALGLKDTSPPVFRGILGAITERLQHQISL